MTRSAFGAWGASLSAEEFALAIAAVGVLGPPFTTDHVRSVMPKVQRTGGDIVPLSTKRLQQLLRSIDAGSRDVPDATQCVDAWKAFSQAWRSEQPGARLLRIELDRADALAGKQWAVTAQWLVRSLQAVDAAYIEGAYIRQESPERAVAWEWPLRVAVLGDAQAENLRSQVANIPWPHLVKVNRADVEDDDCDVLLIPSDLRSAAARILSLPRRLRADAVVVIGGTGASEDRQLALMATVRQEVLCSGVAVANVSPDRHYDWLSLWFETLSHDGSLEVAMRAAMNGRNGEVYSDLPLVLASRRLMKVARASAFARRYGRQLRQMSKRMSAAPRSPIRKGLDDALPASARPSEVLEMLGRDLETRVTSGPWHSESGEASDASLIRRKVESTLGESIPLARDDEAETMFLEESVSAERRVQARVFDVTAPGESMQTDRLESNRAYQFDLHIGAAQEDVLVAPASFPEKDLPRRRKGHWLDIYFVPLVRNGSGRLHTPQHGRLFLPRTGDSGTCSMTFRTHGVVDEYRARVLVAHEGRVIQTLLLVSGLDRRGTALRFEVENVVSPTLDPAWRSRPFDASIVVNHSPSGHAGFTAIVGNEVAFREPIGIGQLIDEVKALLSKEASFPEVHDSLDDPALTQLLDKLARYGRSILKVMPELLQGSVPEGARIQVVEARSGAWLPVEIFHGSRVPNPTATMCPNARKSLLREDGVTHETCPHRDDPSHHCPGRFWGLSSVIERQPATGALNGADYALTVPSASADRLDMLRSALVGASDKFRKKDLEDPGGLLDAIKAAATASTHVKTWDEWVIAIEQQKPSLLMLFPHSLQDGNNVGIPALEIGASELSFPQIESIHVTVSGQAPVVFLLGCSTSLADVPFLNFVEAFKREKAALVIGTLAIIRGRRTVAFVSELLSGVRTAAGTNKTFGEVFLECKRKLLANGDGFVLSLTAYGDVGWRFH